MNITDAQHEAFFGLVEDNGFDWTVSFTLEYMGIEAAATLIGHYFRVTEDSTHKFLVENLETQDPEMLVSMFGTGRVGAAMAELGWNVYLPNLVF